MNLPAMAGLLLIHPLLRTAWNAVTQQSNQRGHAGRARLQQRTSFDFIFAFIFLIALHGFSAIKVLAILFANYQVATKLPKRYVPVATWAYNIATLFANELCEGYRFRDAAALISPPDPITGESRLMQYGGFLDNHGGLMPRWHVLFNLTILRLISFNLDYYWSFEKRNVDAIEVSRAQVAWEIVG
jgi:hypothetical protein